MATSLPPERLHEYQDFARSIANEAAEMAAGNYGQANAQRKFDGSLVTETDEASDRLLTERIASAYPDHAVLSEEQSTLYDPAFDMTWVLDPIDGTTNFARGLPIWGVSVGLLYQGYPVVGVLAFPLLHEVFSGSIGFGATRNSSPIQSTTIQAPESEYLISTCTRTSQHYRLDTPLKVRNLGSAAYHLAKVADGSVLAGVESTPKIWDLAGAAVIVAEAGGVLTKIDGSPLFPVAEERLDYKTRSMPVMAAGNDVLLDHLTTAIVNQEQ